MEKLVSCKNRPENPVVFKRECPVILGTITPNDHCQECPFNPFFTKKHSNAKLIKPKVEIVNQGPWRGEAVEIPKNPFTEKQYKAIEKRIKPISGFDLRSKITHAATWYLASKKQSEGKPRLAHRRKNLEQIKELAGELSDLLRNKTDDETLISLGPVWQKIYNCDDDVLKIYHSSIAELRSLPVDSGGGGTKPWEPKVKEAYFRMIADIYEQGTGEKVERGNDRVSGNPTREYKRLLDFFRQCLGPVNPSEKLSDSAIDGKIKNYLKPTKN